MPKVSGSSSATPDGGPTPGSAPIRMPMTTPQTAISRLNGVSATEKPSARFEAKSIVARLRTRTRRSASAPAASR